MSGNGDRLDSWKAIAEYLGRDRTTVMRWERSAGLPVRRVQGGGGRSVFAYKSELDQWLADGATGLRAIEEPAPAAPVPEVRPPSLSHIGVRAALLMAVMTAVLAASWVMGSTSPIATARLVGEEIVATDGGGREVFRYPLPHVNGGVVPQRLSVTDLDDDARPELVAAMHFMPRDGHSSGTLLALDGRGRLRWQQALRDHYWFGGEEFGPEWFPEDVLVYRTGGAARVAVAYHHQTWWPSVVVTYDAGGQPVDRFVHSGWIRSLNISRDGRYLLAAGITNTFGGAALAVLDAARPSGTSPNDGGTLPSCSNCPARAPVAYYVVPWTRLARPSDTPNVVVQTTGLGEIEWHAVQRTQEGGKTPDVIVTISPELQVRRRAVNHYFAELGSTAASTSAEEPSIRQWMPATGWRDVTPAN